MLSWIMDGATALRGLARHRAFAATALLTLALGIGANTAIISAASGVLWRPLPYPQADRLVHIWAYWPGGSGNLSFPDGVAIGERSRTLEATAVYQAYGSVALTGRTPAANLSPSFVTPSYFQILGARPALGRLINAEDDPDGVRGGVAVLGAAAWNREFGADPGIVGRTVHLNGLPFEIIGVLDDSFADLGAVEGPSPDIFLPTVVTDRLMSQPPRTETLRLYWGLGRLKPGASVENAREDLAAIAASMEKERPATHRGYGLHIASLSDHIRGGFRMPAILLIIGAFLVLLIGCANVVNLLLVRLGERRREMSLRAALGASSSRLFRQAFVEALVLAGLGGVLGTVVGLFTSRFVSDWVAANVSPFVDVTFDPRALAAALVLTALCCLGIAIVPALGSLSLELRASLSSGTRSEVEGGGGFARRAFMAGGVALALVLLTGAGLMLRSFSNLTDTPMGLRSERLLTFRMDISGPRYLEAGPRIRLVDEFVERVKALPGVESATAWGPSMLGRATWVVNVAPAELPNDRPDAFTMLFRHSVSPAGLDGLGIERVSGRDFTVSDSASAPLVAIVSESVARQLWPDQDPVGRQLVRSAPGLPPIQVIGVARDVRHRQRFAFDDARIGIIGGLGPQRDIYFPYAQRANNGVTFAVRVAGDDPGILAALQRTASSLDPDLPVADARFLEDRLHEQEKLPRALAGLMVLSAVIAALLAAVGIYGVISQAVGRRTREIGLRVALGAARRDILALVARQGLAPAVGGALVGLVASAGLGRWASAILFDVRPHDPLTLAGVLVVIVALGALAAAIPARRALRVDPSVALRSE